MAPRPIYRNPFRFDVSPLRIDAGVDYAGRGPVHAIGPAVILQVGVPSHTYSFGCCLSSYRLTAGPLDGLVVYFAEHYDLHMKAKPGDRVDKSNVLYDQNGAIEIGFGTDDGKNSIAWHELGYSEGELSRVGVSFSNLMKALGAPAGLRMGRQVSGPLPARYNRKWAQELRGWIA